MKSLISVFRAVFVISMITLLLFPSAAGVQEFATVGGGLVVLSLFMPEKQVGMLYTVIGLDAARSAFTNAIVAVYRERITPSSFLRSFFPATYSPTKLVSIEVKRGKEKVASDVLRGTGSNLNKKSRSTLKTIEPPLYSEAHNVNELDIYDTAFGTLDPKLMAQLAVEAAEELVEIQNTIERAYEKQAAEVLTSGVITLKNGDNIDFKRKSDSLVDDGAGSYWTVSTVDPMVALAAGGQFIREVGKSQGGTYNVIMGGSALNALLNNPIFQAKYDKKDITLGEIREPQRNSTGGTLHGRVSAGAYVYNIWTYPEGYTNASDVFVKYIADTDIIILPEVTHFTTAYALVPQLPGMAPLQTTAGGAYVFNEYLDPKNRNHVQEILSAGVTIPVAIDQIYTQKVTAA